MLTVSNTIGRMRCVPVVAMRAPRIAHMDKVRYSKPALITTRGRDVKVQSSTIETVTYIVGKGIILFTMFYCGLNWMYYRDIRIKSEEEDDKNTKDK